MSPNLKIIIIIFLIATGAFGYSAYEKYSPLVELSDCDDCIDYKKIQVTKYETPVPDITIVGADGNKMIMDIPIIIYNPSVKDTEIFKIEFDLYMEGKHLTKGVIPSKELLAMENTTIVMEDVELKYTELVEVIQILVERHGMEMVVEGKANVSMTSDLLIYLPIEMFGMKIYTFTVPITIETDIPIDMLNLKEYVNSQIEDVMIESVTEMQENMEETLSILDPDENDIPITLPTLP